MQSSTYDHSEPAKSWNTKSVIGHIIPQNTKLSCLKNINCVQSHDNWFKDRQAEVFSDKHDHIYQKAMQKYKD